MAEKLNNIFKIVEEKGGLKARMRLALKTGISKTRALELPDDIEIINKLKDAASEILGINIDNLLKGGL